MTIDIYIILLTLISSAVCGMAFTPLILKFCTQKSDPTAWRYRLYSQYDGGSVDHIRLPETSISFSNHTYQPKLSACRRQSVCDLHDWHHR